MMKRVNPNGILNKRVHAYINRGEQDKVRDFSKGLRSTNGIILLGRP